MSDRRKVLPQYLLPKRGLTAFAGRVASRERGATTTRLVRWFVRKYGVDMAEAANPDITSYASFNDFFTRALKQGARPLADADLVCPVDGTISQFGAIDKDQILQAKGHRYSTTALVGGDAALAERFRDGSFATLYLSPKDYHRIHMPCDGVLTRMIDVPGAFFSVNPTTARAVPGLFARNERVVCVFESKTVGCFVLVLVGATIVGSMATVWHGVVNPPRVRRVREWNYADGQVALKQGEEMGRFLLGSTVVLLFGKDAGLAFNPAWAPGRAIRLGEAMADAAAALS
ncbi:MAG: archaetidylserine decarboxylase [Caldimonas sp.]